MRTGDNAKFLRLWYEISFDALLLGCESVEQQVETGSRWIPYNKGGEFRKWYGNNDYVVFWENNGYAIKENTRRVYPQLGDNLGWKISNEKYYYQAGITWSSVTTGDFGCRCYGKGFIFDSGANGFFPNGGEEQYKYFAGLLNSSCANLILKIINPTINCGAGTLNQVPVIVCEDKITLVSTFVDACIEISCNDWDSFETSWDFKKHPLI